MAQRAEVYSRVQVHQVKVFSRSRKYSKTNLKGKTNQTQQWVLLLEYRLTKIKPSLHRIYLDNLPVQSKRPAHHLASLSQLHLLQEGFLEVNKNKQKLRLQWTTKALSKLKLINPCLETWKKVASLLLNLLVQLLEIKTSESSANSLTLQVHSKALLVILSHKLRLCRTRLGRRRIFLVKILQKISQLKTQHSRWLARVALENQV